jgi:ferredoxin
MMSRYKIIHMRELCIGCGACANACPGNWEMADDGKSRPKKTELGELGCNKEAADACPVSCIKIEEVK